MKTCVLVSTLHLEQNQRQMFKPNIHNLAIFFDRGVRMRDCVIIWMLLVFICATCFLPVPENSIPLLAAPSNSAEIAQIEILWFYSLHTWCYFLIPSQTDHFTSQCRLNSGGVLHQKLRMNNNKQYNFVHLVNILGCCFVALPCTSLAANRHLVKTSATPSFFKQILHTLIPQCFALQSFILPHLQGVLDFSHHNQSYT